MSLKCLNLADPKIKELVNNFGEYEVAEVLENNFKDAIPTVEEFSKKVRPITFNTEAEAAHIRKLLPKEIGIKLQDDYIQVLFGGNVAIGVFEDAFITLTRSNYKGVAYHEAFHAVFRTMLTQEQRNALIAEVNELSLQATQEELSQIMKDFGVGINEATAIYREEQLADAFADYMVEGNTNYSKGILGLFERLADWIKHVFSSKYTQRKLFSDINRGKFANKKPNITRSKAFAKHPGYRYTQKNEIVKQLVNSAFSYNKYDEEGKLEEIVTIQTLDDLYKLDIQNVNYAISDTYLDAMDADDTDVMNTLGDLVDITVDTEGLPVIKLKEYWVEEIHNYMKANLGIKLAKSERIKAKYNTDKITTENNEDNDVEDDFENGNELRKASFEVSGKDNATAAVKFLIAMLPAINRQGQVSHSKLTNMPQLVDFGTTYNTVENLLAGSVSKATDTGTSDILEEMLVRLKKQAKFKPELGVLASRLEDASEETQNQFVYAFAREKLNMIDHVIGVNGENVTSKLKDLNVNDRSNVIKLNWDNSFEKKLSRLEGDKLVYNSEMIDVFFQSKSEFDSNVILDGKNGFLSEDTIKAFKNSLEALGINLSDRAIEYIIDNNLVLVDKQGNPIPKDRAEINAISSIKVKYDNAVKGLKDKTGDFYDKNKKNFLEDQNSFFKDTLANAEAEFTVVTGENTMLGPGGNTYWGFQDSSMTSKIVNQFKQGDLTRLQELANNPYSSNSVIVKQLLSSAKAREAFELVSYGNLRDENSQDRGDKASNLKPNDAYIDVFIKTLSGYHVGLAEADKSSQNYFKTESLGINSGITQQGGSLVINPSSRATRVIQGYLKAEYDRSFTAQAAVYDNALPEEEWTIYYHYYPVAEGKGTIGAKKDKIPGNAFHSFMFPDIDYKSLGLFDNDGKFMLVSNETFSKATKSLVEKALINNTISELKVAKERGLIESKDGKLVSRMIPNNIMEARQNSVIAAVADYTVLSIIGNIESTMLFNGDPAEYKVKGVGTKSWSELDLFDDFNKRIPLIWASGKTGRIFKERTGDWAVRPKYRSATIANINTASAFFANTDEKGIPIKDADGNYTFNEKAIEDIVNASGLPDGAVRSLFSSYLKINQTDAQAWITLEAYRERMRAYGKWSFGENSHESAYNKMQSGETLTGQELSLLAQPLKTVHTERRRNSQGVLITEYNKQSEAPLLPIFTNNLELNNLRLAMEEQGLDHVIVLDGKKVGASGIIDIMEDGKIKSPENIEFNAVELSYNNLMLQQDLTPHGVGNTLVGSQAVKNTLAVINIGEVYMDMEAIEAIDTYHRTLGNLSDKGLLNLKKKIGYNEETGDFNKDSSTGISMLNKLVADELEGEISEDYLEVLKTEDISLSALPLGSKIENKLQAMVTKSTVKLKQPGGAFVQLADLGVIGMEVDLTKPVKDGIIWLGDPTERLSPMSIDGNEVKPTQILLPHSKLVEMLGSKALKKDMLEKFGTDNYKELSTEQIRTFIDMKVAEGFSYRIPNQGPSSNDAFVIKGFLPIHMGDTMIAYSDITVKTGSDFDIDKAFVILPNMVYDSELKQIKVVSFRDKLGNIEVDKLDEKGLQNLRLALMRAFLLHPKSYVATMSPLDDDSLEKFIKKLFPKVVNNSPLNYYKGSNQLNTKVTFDNAKSLVGVIANHMSHHSLAKEAQLQFNEYFLGIGNQVKTHAPKELLTDKELAKGTLINANSTVFDLETNTDGVAIFNVLMKYMNAIVDAAKDPYISRANINQSTAGTAFMLARAGVPEQWITAFIGQPIIKDYIENQGKTEGRFKQDFYDTDRRKRLNAMDLTLKAYSTSGTMTPQELASEEYDMNTISLDVLVNNINSKELDKKEQLKIFKKFLEYQKMAKALNDVITFTKVDVKGATKTINTAKLQENLFNKIIADNQILNFDKLIGFKNTKEGIEFLKGEGRRMMGAYYENSVLASIEMYQDKLLTTSHASTAFLTNIAFQTGYTNLIPSSEIEDIVIKIPNEFQAAVFTHTKALNLTSGELFTLLFGRESKVGQPAQLSVANMLQNAKDSHLKENKLISDLKIRKGKNGMPDNIYLPNNALHPVSIDVYLESMEELYATPETKDLANKLILYSFYSSGFSAAVGSFYSAIPSDWLRDNEYFAEVGKLVEEASYGNYDESFEDKFFKNNYLDTRFVPVVHSKGFRPITLTSNNQRLPESVGFALNTEDNDGYTSGINANGQLIYKPFLRRNILYKDGTSEDLLYKLAFYVEGDTPIYLRVNKLGNQTGANTIKEYNGDGQISVIKNNNVSLQGNLAHWKEFLKVQFENGTKRELPVKNYDPMESKETPEETGRAMRLQFCTIINTK
jgi:hypothetical protein